jgi:hypothetical protein
MKGKEITITIGGRKPEEMSEAEAPVAEMLNEAELADEEMYDKMSPTGEFTKKGLNNLVSATNRLLPVFGQTPDYPTFTEDLTKLPTDFVRVLSMFADAVDDAMEAEVVGADMALSLDAISDDLSLTAAASKLDALSRNKEFKKFLKEPYAKSESKEKEEIGPVKEDVMDEETMNSLFMQKM